VRSLAWFMPATYGLRLFQDVILRGFVPLLQWMIGLVGFRLVLPVLAIGLAWRRLQAVSSVEPSRQTRQPDQAITQSRQSAG
jgi:hypothetical protein